MTLDEPNRLTGQRRGDSVAEWLQPHEVGMGSISAKRLLGLWPQGERLPACLVPSLNSNTFHFYRKREGARKVRRRLRRAKP